MADIAQKHEFIFEAGRQLPRVSWGYVTRVIAANKNGDPSDHRGTALMYTIAGRQAFVTANHVLTEIAKDARFSCAGLSCMSKGTTVATYSLPEIDIAVLIPDTPVEVPDDKQFWPADRFDATTDQLVRDYMLVQGFPARFTRFTAFGPSHVSNTYVHCTSVRPRQSDFSQEVWDVLKNEGPIYPPIPDELLKPGQFALNYAEETGPLKTAEGESITKDAILQEYAGLYTDGVALPGQQSFGAYGMSGSPVWRFGADECD